jgi:hypothetical protein
MRQRVVSIARRTGVCTLRFLKKNQSDDFFTAAAWFLDVKMR